MSTLCLIPARYASTRLPGKALLMIKGKAIIQRVYQQVQKCKLVDTIVVLTDDERIKNAIEQIGGRCELVSEPCLNGTERIVKWLQHTGMSAEIIVNVQGDEPFINPQFIDQCIANYKQKTNSSNLSTSSTLLKCSTLHFKMPTDKEELMARSTGKLVLDRHNNIMYCSRNVIPGGKKELINTGALYYGHIGVFVFEPRYLLTEYLVGNTPYQLSEDIEWLKILEDGYRINSVLVDAPEISVDTPEDYKYLVEKYNP